MTKLERKKLIHAINLLNREGGDFHKGMSILMRLVDPNWRDPLHGLKLVSIREIAKGPDREFGGSSK